MTTPVCVRRRIRQLDRQGLSHREISRKLGVSRTTVVKYANHGDCSPKPLGSGHAGRSLVDAGYSAVVDGWPAADLRMPVKQRHTATRVYERLVAECGFTGSYSSVRRWVKRWRREHRVESDGFAELEWAPGSAQVDFGQARAVVAGVERVVHFLVVSFPYSNMRWVVALPGETSECVCQGLLWIFERMGMAPRVVVFDNATGVGHRRPDGTAARTRLFSLFRAHYGFGCLCSISCCGFSHDDFSGLGRACRPRNGLNWMVLVSPPERTGKDYDQHAPSTVYPSFAAERGIRRVDRAENTCQRADGA